MTRKERKAERQIEVQERRQIKALLGQVGLIALRGAAQALAEFAGDQLDRQEARRGQERDRMVN